MMDNMEDFRNVVQRMDNAYKCMKAYLERREAIDHIIMSADSFHDESIDLLNKAYESADTMVAKYKASLYALIEQLDDAEGV